MRAPAIVVGTRLLLGLGALSLAGLPGCRGCGGGGEGRPTDLGAPDGPRGVYAITDGPADPLVLRLCDALHGTRYLRRAECCAPPSPDGGSPSVTTTGEEPARCVRLLGAAFRGGAVRLDAAEVDRCASAMAELYTGCDFVGYEPLPVPAACRGVVHGLLGRGSGCRSSEECQGNEHCEGLGNETTGTCRPPHGHGALCQPPIDPLAVLLLDERLDETHPYCSGHCERGRCVVPITAAGPCEKSEQCAPGYHCGRQRCLAGWLPKAGQPCTTACERPARCLKGTCTTPGREGTPCALDDECIGRCLREGETGRCGPPCSR